MAKTNRTKKLGRALCIIATISSFCEFHDSRVDFSSEAVNNHGEFARSKIKREVPRELRILVLRNLMPQIPGIDAPSTGASSGLEFILTPPPAVRSIRDSSIHVNGACLAPPNMWISSGNQK